MKDLIKKLISIQEELKVPKNQWNDFGDYPYRSCEDIIESVKPLLIKNDLLMTISDEIKYHSDLRTYIEATVTVTDGENSISVSGYAREAVAKKKMDDSQITGSTSSYARKYALNGMFGIDDTKDADATNKQDNQMPVLTDNDKQWIEQARNNKSVLDQIQDPEYRKFIENNM